MKQLSRNQNILFLIGAVLMVVGAGIYVFTAAKLAAWLFAVGAFTFAAMQLQLRYEGSNLTLQRLRRIMIIGDILFMFAAVLMIENVYHFLLPLFMNSGVDGYNTYINYIHNNWVVVLLIAAILELYSTHRISAELDKEAKKR